MEITKNQQLPQAEQAPVAIFAFNRPEQTRALISILREARPEKIFLIMDGPRGQKPGEVKLVEETREILETIDWTTEIFRDYADVNLGLRERLLSGLDFVFSKSDKAIVLEDDCHPDRSFFPFCNDMLSRYEHQNQISIISGFNFAPLPSSESYFFYSGSLIWGWATWAKNWHMFRASPQVEEWPREELKALLGKTPGLWAKVNLWQMMRNAKKLKTWDISLEVFFRQQGMLSVVPSTNLVINDGFGKDATHTKIRPGDIPNSSESLKFPLTHPREIFFNPPLERKMWRRRLVKFLWESLRDPSPVLRKLYRNTSVDRRPVL